MKFEEFKQIILNKAKEKNLPKEALIRLRSEIYHAGIYYNEVGDLYEDLKSRPVRTDAGVIPYLLGITDKFDLDKVLTFRQTRPGASGGIDVDSDFSGTGRDTVIQYLKSKYGEECVTPVGTVSTLQMKVACKDLLRYATCPVADANMFTSELNDELSFQDNIEHLLKGNSPAKDVYIKYKKILDLTPRFLGKSRNIGKHAGGVVVTPRPIWNFCPVERSDETIVTAYQESGSNAVLDNIGLIKLDLLAISVLDTIEETFQLIDEPLFLIEENGYHKIVPLSYIKECEEKGVEIHGSY